MKLLNSLRSRIIFTSFGMSLVVSLLFLAGGMLALDIAEDSLFDKRFDSEAETFIQLYKKYPSVISMQNGDYQVYVARHGDRGTVPSYLRGLAVGADEVTVNGQERDLLVKESNGNIFYFLINNRSFENFENIFFAAMLLATAVILCISFALSLTVANRIIVPITRLTRLVSGNKDKGGNPGDPNEAVSASDEIQILEKSFYEYHERISSLLEREREFSTDVSHELRTPLMGIQGAAERICRHSDTGDRNHELAVRIMRGCQQMSSLIEGMLYLAKEPTNFSGHVEAINVNDLVDDYVTTIGDLASRKGITIHKDFRNRLVIDAIPVVLSVVVNNVILNAVKYTDHNKINIFIHESAVVVQDFGPGMDDKTQNRLFKRYERGHADNDGSGIGLFLVRRFCEQFGWQLDVKSNPSTGTVISILFPEPG